MTETDTSARKDVDLLELTAHIVSAYVEKNRLPASGLGDLIASVSASIGGLGQPAVPEVVPEEAGFLVPVDDVDAFSAALRRLLNDPEERSAKAEGARRAGAILPDWAETAKIISNALGKIS